MLKKMKILFFLFSETGVNLFACLLCCFCVASFRADSIIGRADISEKYKATALMQLATQQCHLGNDQTKLIQPYQALAVSEMHLHFRHYQRQIFFLMRSPIDQFIISFLQVPIVRIFTVLVICACGTHSCKQNFSMPFSCIVRTIK